MKCLTYVYFYLYIFPQKSHVNPPKVLIFAHTSTPVRLVTRVYIWRSVCMCVYVCVRACVCVHMRLISHSFTSRIWGSHMGHVTQTQLGHHPGGHHRDVKRRKERKNLQTKDKVTTIPNFLQRPVVILKSELSTDFKRSIE